MAIPPKLVRFKRLETPLTPCSLDPTKNTERTHWRWEEGGRIQGISQKMRNCKEVPKVSRIVGLVRSTSRALVGQKPWPEAVATHGVAEFCNLIIDMIHTINLLDPRFGRRIQSKRSIDDPRWFSFELGQRNWLVLLAACWPIWQSFWSWLWSWPTRHLCWTGIAGFFVEGVEAEGFWGAPAHGEDALYRDFSKWE